MLVPLVAGARLAARTHIAMRTPVIMSTNQLRQAVRPLSFSAFRLQASGQSKEDSTPKVPKSDSADTQQVGASENSQRDELWNQMLNTIIIEPDEGASREERMVRSTPRNSLDMLSSISEQSSHAPRNSRNAMEELEREFRERATLGFPEPAKPTTGRSFAASPSMANKVPAAVLYRNLMATLRRNNVRYELRLGERYEKPNQMRRRKRSERHRRRFADMIRKKVQLVRPLLTRSWRSARASRACRL